MIPSWEDFLAEVFLDPKFNEIGYMTLKVGLRRPLNIARKSQSGDSLQKMPSSPPGGDSVPLHWHPADLPLQQLAG